MNMLFGFIKPQIAFGAGGRGGGGASSPKPTGFADQAARMANSQRQLGAPQMPGFNLEAEKDIPSVAKRKSSRDNSPIDTGSGGFLGGFQKSPKSGSGGGSSYGSDPNPFHSAFGSSKGSGTSSTNTGRLDLSGIGGTNPVEAPKPSMPSMPDRGTAPVRDSSPLPDFGGRPPRKQPKTEFDPDRRRPMPGDPNVMRTAPTLKKPPMPRVIADDFIPRNPDGSPKYTTPDGRPSRGPSFEMPSRPTPNPGGGKGGGGIARPPKRKPVAGPKPLPVDPITQPMPTPFPDPRPKRPSTPISDPRLPTRPERPTTPAKRPIVGPPVMRPGPTIPGGGKGGAGPRPTRPSTPVTTRPSTPAPQQPIQAQPVRRPVYDPRSSTPVPTPMPYGGKGGGSMPTRTTRQPEQPFTYYRPKR